MVSPFGLPLFFGTTTHDDRHHAILLSPIYLSLSHNCVQNYFDILVFKKRVLSLYTTYKMSTLFVTAYKDIGRRYWNAYERPQSKYISVFTKMALSISKFYTLIVYCSKEVQQECLEECKKVFSLDQFPPNVIFYGLEEVNTFYDRYIETERAIMRSPEYNQNIPWDRKENPEHKFAEYNLINHSKINFVADAKKRYNNYEYYVWVDFGLNDYPTKDLNMEQHCPPGKIVYGLNTPMQPFKISPKQMLSSHVIYFMGSEFVAHKDAVEPFENAFEETLLWLHTQNVSDDDQNVVLQVYYRHPELFHLLPIGEWFSMFKRFLNRV